jgi:predicted regulator of Ras-like GTPase activity (Roadblock/LC7/MglB family)
LIKEIQNELGADFLYMDIVGTDGLPIAGLSAVNIDTSAVAARFALIGKLAIKVADKLNVGDVEDNLITINTSYALMHMLGDGSYFAVMGLAKAAPLGVVRMLMKDYSEQLWDAIPR